MLTQEVAKVSLHYLWCRGKVVITTSHVHPAKPQPRFSAGLSLTFLTFWQKQAFVDVLQTSCFEKFLAIFTGKHRRWCLFLIKRDSNTGVFL